MDPEETTHVSPADAVVHQALQQLLDRMKYDEVAHLVLKLEWVNIPIETPLVEIIKTASANIQIDDLCEAEIEGLGLSTEVVVSAETVETVYHVITESGLRYEGTKKHGKFNPPSNSKFFINESEDVEPR